MKKILKCNLEGCVFCMVTLKIKFNMDGFKHQGIFLFLLVNAILKLN